MRKFLAVVLATIIFTIALMPTVVGATTYPARQVNVLVIYDESYEYFLGETGIDDPVDRLRQSMKLAAMPFKKTWNITLNFIIKPYSEIFGFAYSMNPCGNIHTLNEAGEYEWTHANTCGCFNVENCNPSGTSLGHHTNAYNLYNVAMNYLGSHNELETVNSIDYFYIPISLLGSEVNDILGTNVFPENEII